MGHPKGFWTRRQFAGLAVATAASFAAGYGFPAPPSRPFVYVACKGGKERNGAIHVFDTSGSHWRLVQTLDVPAPAHLEVHPTLPILYVVHEVASWAGRPCGAVSAFAIHHTSGQLTLCNSQPLSLSATHPSHAAIAATRGHLVVAARSGAIYNVLPLAGDGALLSPCAARKEVGMLDGEDFRPSVPRQVFCHPDGQSVLAVDEGLGALSSFAIGSETIHLCGRSPLSGCRQAVLSPCGTWVYALRPECGRLEIFHYSHRTKRISHQGACIIALRGGTAAMAMHPSGRFIVITDVDRFFVLRIGALSGIPYVMHSAPSGGRLQALLFTPDGTSMAAVEQSRGRIISLQFNPIAGRLGEPQDVAQVESASSLAFAVL